MLTIIAAASENNALGKDNDLVWHLPNDFKRFKALTTGHHIIITRQKDYIVPDGCVVVSSLKKAIKICPKDDENFIIGGGQIYKQSIDGADKIELTRVHTEIDADTFFPEIDIEKWKLINEEFHSKDEKHQYDFT
jgi:dihydrofolate reductase